MPQTTKPPDAGTTRATTAQTQTQSPLVDKINSNTLMILSTGSGLTYGPMAADLATVLNDGDNLRILPAQGYSAYQNVRDVCYLRGIDMAFTRTNILGHWRRSGEIPDLDQKIVYILKVANGEENIIVKAPDITSIEQLRGKKVNFNQVGSGTQMSARDIFSAFKVGIEETNLSASDALQKLKDGEITAVVVTAGKPSPVLRRLKRSEGYRMIPIPLKDSLIGDYVPATLEHDDYPDLIPEGQSVDTLASGIVIIAYNWPKNSDRYRRIDKFVNALFPRLAEFQEPPRHEKWKDTILAANVPGWKRFDGAEQWLKNDREQQLAANQDRFQQFLTSRDPTTGGKVISEADRQKLFEDFMRWMKQSTAR
ncbi:MAG TPA: TAXI family TRAP transporter solute-binding subunit [Xanthobacteraceae bacterium]